MGEGKSSLAGERLGEQAALERWAGENKRRGDGRQIERSKREGKECVKTEIIQ